MHSKLTIPPLTYVLLQLKFSSIENIAIYITRLQDKIRDIFPHYQEVNIQAIQLGDGQTFNTTTLKQWHFMNKEKNTGVILDKETITIHTSRYDQFLPMLNIFKDVSTRFQEILNISLFTRLGLRYINLIEDGLTDIDEGLQGFQLTDHSFDSTQFITRTETTQRSQEGFVKIQATRIGDKKIIGPVKNIFVPPELVETATFLSFGHQTEPKENFLMLDIDHFSETQDDFDIPKILSCFTRLQEVLYQVFCQAVGPKNLKNWE